MSKKLLELSHIDISYDSGKSFILRDISFSLHSWEILSIIWKNGTWKSSLLKTIAWIQKPFCWNISLQTQKIAYVPQKIQLEKNFPVKVKEFFAMFHQNLKIQKIESLAKLFSVNHLLENNIHTLSGGEFQKILIVSALVSDPEIILLDEPTSWIDRIWEEAFYKNISEIRKNYPQMAIILVSHNLHLVYKNSTRVICLHENNLCCHGTPSEVLENEDVKHLFWKYLRPYEHTAHKKHDHPSH